MRYDFNLIPEDTKPYFRDIYDHVLRINEMIDNVRELVTTALEANLSVASVAQQEDTRRLAAWAAIIAVPTMIAGIYGMNFEVMPELQWQVPATPSCCCSRPRPVSRCSSDSNVRVGSDVDPGYISTCTPSSTTRSGGRRKNAVARTAFRVISTNSRSRQIAMPGRSVTTIVSRPRK